MKKRFPLLMLLTLLSLHIGWAQNTVESIRQRSTEAKEYARTHTGSDLYDGADFGEYYHLEARQWLPGTGGHIENTYLYYDEVDSDDDVIYKPHWLKFVTKRFNYAAREYYQEFLYDADGKVAFIYAYDPMTQLEGDENDSQYEFRFYFSKGRPIKAIVKRKQGDDKEFRQVYDDNAILPAYRQPYNELLTAAHTIRQLFTDIEKEAYKYKKGGLSVHRPRLLFYINTHIMRSSSKTLA